MESRKLGFRPKHFPKNATATLNDQHSFRIEFGNCKVDNKNSNEQAQH